MPKRKQRIYTKDEENRMDFYQINPVDVKSIPIISPELNKKRLSSRSFHYWKIRGFNDIDSNLLCKSRMPGQYEYYRIYKKQTIEEAKESLKEFSKDIAMTLENMIKKYGDQDGKKKWEEYCKKQSETNTFEYKKEKYGWTQEQFDEYNATRSCTKENFIKRHGKIKGTKAWKQYCQRQGFTNTLEYFIEKYGNDDGEIKYNQMVTMKSHTYDSFLMRFDGDEELSKKEYKKYLAKTNKGYSNVANNLFDIICIELKKCNITEIYYHNLNGEKYFRLKTMNIKVDFYEPKSKKVIEFFGDYWHGNPKLYKNKTELNFLRGKRKLVDIWEFDKRRIGEMIEHDDIDDVLVVWERDYYENPDKTIKKCIDFLVK